MVNSQESKYIDKYKLCDFSDENMMTNCKGIFWNLAKSMIKGFKISNDNLETMASIFAYFHGNSGTLDLNKGIYLFGEFGCGKTSLFVVFSRYLATTFPFSANGFGNASIEEVGDYYKTGTDERGNKKNSVEKYVYSELTGKPREVCFHEIGKQVDEKYYGTSMNQVINSLMMRRYEIYQKYGTRTHITSNFHPSKLTSFDDATIDRFKEMFNFVEWKGESLRK